MIFVPPFLVRPLADEAATCDFGRALAPLLGSGDTVLLSGEPGAGKTCLARAIIQAIAGDNTHVTSPTFALLQTYSGPEFPIWHADLYRLRQACEIAELGLEESEDSLRLIEWPECALDRLGRTALAIRLDFADKERQRHMSLGGGEDWPHRLAALT